MSLIDTASGELNDLSIVLQSLWTQQQHQCRVNWELELNWQDKLLVQSLNDWDNVLSCRSANRLRREKRDTHRTEKLILYSMNKRFDKKREDGEELPSNKNHEEVWQRPHILQTWSHRLIDLNDTEGRSESKWRIVRLNSVLWYLEYTKCVFTERLKDQGNECKLDDKFSIQTTNTKLFVGEEKGSKGYIHPKTWPPIEWVGSPLQGMAFHDYIVLRTTEGLLVLSRRRGLNWVVGRIRLMNSIEQHICEGYPFSKYWRKGTHMRVLLFDKVLHCPPFQRRPANPSIPDLTVSSRSVSTQPFE